MKITSARFETKQELENRMRYFKNKKSNTTELCLKYLEENSKDLVDKHNRFYEEFNSILKKENLLYQMKIHETAKQRHSEYFQAKRKLQKGENVWCECGHKLRYISGEFGDFIGCTNYKDTSKSHSNLKPQNQEIVLGQNIERTQDRERFYEPSSIYLNDFKKFYNIPEYVTAWMLYKTLLSNRVDFLYPLTNENFLVGSRELQSSKLEESILYNKFKQIADTYYQKGIKYTSDENLEEKLKIPDYIIKTKTKTLVVDAKKCYRNVNQTQLNTYVELVSYLAKKNGNNNPVYGYFYIFNPEDKSDDFLFANNCITQNTYNNIFTL